ncbi:hypothetical protein ACJ7VZ_05390 [Aeromonas salmonicida]|uniref:hypothetical protein n=1 Tax=Aeromonas salmonicida TaxID=645 RepID=UPI0038BC9CD9
MTTKILTFEESVERCNDLQMRMKNLYQSCPATAADMLELAYIVQSMQNEMKLIREGKPVPAITKQKKEKEVIDLPLNSN